MSIADLALLREVISEGTALITAIQGMLKQLRRLRVGRSPSSYENVSLALLLNIQDGRGLKAELDRRQVVEFKSVEAGVIRDLVWGDGNTLGAFTAAGARLMGKRREGSKDALLLVLPEGAAVGQRVVVRSKRVVVGALTHRTEYFEVQVERCTRRLSLKVTFPRHRPPMKAWVTSTPIQSPLPPLRTQRGKDGKASLHWRLTAPKVFCTYRLNWSW